MTTSDLTRDLMYRLEWEVIFSNGNATRQTKDVVKKCVTQAWESGKMPVMVGERIWLVGWKVHKTFFGASVTPIMVGPKKPRMLRERYYSDVVVKTGT